MDAMACEDIVPYKKDVLNKKPIDMSWIMHVYRSRNWRTIRDIPNTSRGTSEQNIFRNFSENRRANYSIINVPVKDTNIPEYFKYSKSGVVSLDPAPIDIFRVVSVGESLSDAKRQLGEAKRVIRRNIKRF